MRPSSGSDRASLSGLFVCSVMGLLSLAALTFDGGRVVDAYSEISMIAASAARLGGQELIGIRGNSVQVDESRAIRAMSHYLEQFDVEVNFDVSEKKIGVTLRKRITTVWLTTFGIGSRTVKVTRSVEIVAG